MSTEEKTNLWSVIINGAGGEIIIDNSEIYGCYFIEDIYSWCKSGKILLNDGMGSWEFLPLVGDETITIKYASQVKVKPQEWEEKQYTFKIFKINDIRTSPGKTVGTRQRDTRYSLEIFFIEEPHFKLHWPAYSKTWIDYKYYDILKEILDMHVGLSSFVIDEPSQEYVEFFSMSQKTPAKAISWLSERIKGDISGESGYMFYSNTAESVDSYNIATLEMLLRDAPMLDIGEYPGIHFIGGAGNESAINTVTEFAISPADKSSMASLTKEVWLGYDIYRKYMIKNKFDYETSQAHYTTLGKKTLFNGAELMSHMPYEREVLTGESGDKYMDVKCLMDNMYYGNWVRQYCLQQLVSIQVRGHVRRYAGGQIEMNWISGDTHELFNKQYMGRYLVKSITHVFTNRQNTGFYSQKMTLIKNGYWDTDADVSPAAKPKPERTDVHEDIDPIKASTIQDIEKNVKE